MEVTRVEQCAYIKIAVLRGRNAMECHSELVEALGNNALSYGRKSFSKNVRQPVMSNVWDDRTVTAQYYRDFLVRQVRRGVQDKRPDLVVDCVIILHGNARPHKAECVRQQLRRWGWVELEHPPYSSDISPCDFDLISKIKEPIRGRRFVTREDIANTVRQQVTQFTNSAANAEADGIQHFPHRWQRVVTVAGDYIEGL
ncbi:histone-lysine N-methyltransferase SETMAR [Trichonephila clavata]|uniref:Histone-lysine N-methyltransferase SETMAR n=1 Tax=Trichonephila clavata TaxID=2740835 RepID=A0A8X6M0K0_TRICU|nr:histone-lysine N-methyltransferase SETMAR [Trichonephila clavata]